MNPSLDKAYLKSHNLALLEYRSPLEGTVIGDDLFRAVEKFATITKDFDEADLQKPWAWGSYDREGVRFAFFRTYEELQELAVKLELERQNLEIPLTSAQRILGQYHVAYRDLQAVLFVVPNAITDRPPAEGEWSIRRTLAHIVQADLGFYVVIKNALDNHRSAGAEPEEDFDAIWKRMSGLDEDSFDHLMEGSVESLMAYHKGLHGRVRRDFADITEEELEIPSKYWEEEAMSLRFRLHRFDSHIRQHTVQIEKAISDLDHPSNESKRLVRLLYLGLADCERKMIGLPTVGETLRKEAVNSIQSRIDEVVSI